MAKFQQDWTHVASMSAYKQLAINLDVLLSNYSDIFKAELGTIVDSWPSCKAWSVSFAIKGAIKG